MANYNGDLIYTATELIKKIEDYDRNIKFNDPLDDTINLSPDIQRQDRWGLDRKRGLIVSISKNFPIPELRFRYRGETNSYDIFDGKQRLTAITQFIANLYSFKDVENDDHPLNGKYFKDLDAVTKAKFKNYKFRIGVYDLNDEEAAELYQKINTAALRLTPAEVRRGKFSTNTLFKNLITLTNEPLFLEKIKFTQKDMNKLSHEDFILGTFSSVFIKNKNYTSMNDRIYKFLQENQDLDSKQIDLEFKKLLKILDIMPRTNKINFIVYRALVDSLMVTMNYNNIDNLAVEIKKLHDHFINVDNLEVFLKKYKPEFDIGLSGRGGTYQNLMFNSFVDYFTKLTEEEKNQRKVTKELKLQLLANANQCKHCGSKSQLEIDHIKPFSKGGKTEIDNLQLLCSSCNKSKNNRLEY